MRFANSRLVGIAGAAMCASILAACSSGTQMGAGTPHGSAAAMDQSQPCHSRSHVGDRPGQSSTAVELVGLVKGKGDGNTAAFQAITEYATCVTSFTVSGSKVTFSVGASITATQLVYLEQQLWATGRFSSVAQAIR